MYSEEDIQSAVEADAISSAAADALRRHVAALRGLPAVDEERFRLISGFNDVFVSIACLLVIFAAAAVGSSLNAAWLGGLLVSAASWIMAELFTRRRRMALPSIILLIAFIGGLGIAVAASLQQAIPTHTVWEEYTWKGKVERWSQDVHYPWQNALMVLGGAAAAGIGALTHWLRFRVAITVAAVTGSLVLLLLSAVAAIRNVPVGDNPLIAPIALLCGLCVFGYAMRWDLADRNRTSQRADIAFWLHLVAAPLIAHPLFYWMGITRGNSISGGTALGVLAIYVSFAVVAVTVDRRALLVSALAYVLIALTQLFRDYGAIHFNVALTALIIGSALLALSAWWHAIRGKVVGLLPERLRPLLPPLA